MGTPLLYVGVFGPAVVALVLTALEKGRAGLEELLERLTRWQVAAKWYAFAILFFLITKLAAALILRVATGAWPQFGRDAWYVVAFAIIFSWPVQSGEEIGWRGYALPRLSARFGLGAGSVALGIAWALWHLPFFVFIPGPQYGQSFPVFAAGTIALSVAMAWLYANTGGSVLLAMLMHSAINQTAEIVQSTGPVAWLTAALLWIAAIYFLAKMPKSDSKCSF